MACRGSGVRVPSAPPTRSSLPRTESGVGRIFFSRLILGSGPAADGRGRETGKHRCPPAGLGYRRQNHQAQPKPAAKLCKTRLRRHGAQTTRSSIVSGAGCDPHQHPQISHLRNLYVVLTSCFGRKGTSKRRSVRGCGAAGSAPAWHAGGQGFESPQLHFGQRLRSFERSLFRSCRIHRTVRHSEGRAKSAALRNSMPWNGWSPTTRALWPGGMV